MARRTIRARRSSPYLIALVVIFAVLFVAAAVGFGWVWSLRNDDLMKTFGQQRLEQASKSDQDPFKAWFDKYNGKTALVDMIESQEEQTNQYRSLVPPLTKKINSDVPTNLDLGQLKQSVSNDTNAAAEAINSATAVLQKSFTDLPSAGALPAAPGAPAAPDAAAAPAAPAAAPGQEIKASDLVNMMKDQSLRIEALVKQLQDASAAYAQLSAKNDGLEAEKAAQKANYERQVAQAQADLQSERTRLTELRDNALKTAQVTADELKATTDRYMADKTNFIKQMDAMKKNESTLKGQLREATSVVEEYRKVPTAESVDGKIIRLAEEPNLAYGDLGTKDGVMLGMTFSVLSPSEIGKDMPQPKAQVRIVKMADSSCLLRIDLIKKDSPVVEGDLLVNPTFNRSARMSFFLIGRMDLGGGADITERLKALIQKNGGRVENSLTFQTDYLVLGEAPPLPPTPAADASPMVKQAYDRLRQQFIAYQEAKNNAHSMGIVVYPLTRFMSMMGMAGQEP